MRAERKILMYWLLILTGVFLAGEGMLWTMAVEAATLYVDRTDDDATKTDCKDNVTSDCSLRGAVSAANAGDTIMFDWNIKTNLPLPITITLSNEKITINKNLSIIGPGSTADQVIIKQSYSDRHFFVTGTNTQVTFTLLTLQDASNAVNAGSIYVGYGSGISVNINQCIIRNNKNTLASGTDIHGGAIFVGSGSGVIVNQSTISGNESLNRGGAFYVDGGSLTVKNTTISGNKAKSGSAIYLLSGSLTLTHCTITGNTTTLTTASDASVAVRLYGGSANLTNNLIANNTGNGSYDDCHKEAGASLTSSGNLIHSQAYCAPTFTDAITNLDATLKNNGGATLTHALLTGSNAIDKVDRVLNVDQRGESRPSESGKADIGAYEIPESGGGLSFTVTPSAEFSENGGTATLTVVRPDSPATALTVTVSISSPSPATDAKLRICDPNPPNKCELTTLNVTIPAGSTTSNTFQVAGRDNSDTDGPQTVTLTADSTAASDPTDIYASGTKDLTVTDDEGGTSTPISYTLSMEVQPARITEGGTATVTVKLSDPGDSTSITLSIDSAHTADLTISTTNPKPTGGGVATFTILAVTDTTAEGLEKVTITATAPGYDPTAGVSEDVFIRDGGTMSGSTLTFPSFVLHASYDWLHDFKDNNQSASGAAGDPDSDNFNKLIMIDSNLFPIYTALQGDFEMPNVVMRNWTTGPGEYSPSANDYMNRSLAATADYINVTSKIFFGYGSTDALAAVGMRSYMQWVYTVDPANHNFRRYKFIKIADVGIPPYLENGVPEGDVELTPETGAEANIGDCDDCDVCHWYAGGNDALCGGGTGSEIECCDHPAGADSGGGGYDPTNPPSNSCYDDDQVWLFMAKRPGLGCSYGSETVAGGSTVDMPNCSGWTVPPHNVPYNDGNDQAGAPYFRLPVAVKKENISGSNVTVRVDLIGFAHDATSGLALVLNRGISGCESPAVIGANQNFSSASDASGNYIAQPKDYNLQPNSGSCTTCQKAAYQEFTIPLSCAKEDQYSGAYDYMYVDIYPCDKAGIVLQVPGMPEPKDNAFRIPIAGLDDVDTTGMTAAEIQTLIDNRWANLDGYLDVVPPESYPGYPSYTAPARQIIGYGYQTNTTFSSADNVRFKNPRDIAVYRDYYDQANGGPVYIFVADTMNSRIQVFMNATGAAGEPEGTFPIRPVPVKGPNDTSAKTAYRSNELGMRIYSSNGDSVRFGDGRKVDWRQYTTLPGDAFVNITTGKGEFYYPHSIAVDQDPETKDVYLFVADTFNHRIQVFRDVSGVSSQPITAKKFNFQFERGWGTYPLQTTEAMTPPGAYNFRYPKGVSVARFKNNSSYLYVVDSKDYRLMKYEIGENGDGGISGIEAVSGYGYDGSGFVKDLLDDAGTPMTAHNTNPGFWNPQDVATGYSGFFDYTSPHGKGTKFLNNYMVYVTDYARNMTSITRDRLNMRVMQFIQVPGVYKSISGAWIPWETETYTDFAEGDLGQSVYGLTDGVYNSTGGAYKSTGSTGNVPGRLGYFTDRPVGITALQWNTLRPIDIRVIDATKSYLPGESLPRTAQLRIGVSSRKLSFGYPENNRTMFLGYSTEWTDLTGRWDATDAGRVHLFCYDKNGKYINGSHNHADGVLEPSTTTSITPYLVTLSALNCVSGGFVKIVVEDEDFNYSARTGTAFYGVQ